MTARQSCTMSQCRTKPFVGASLSIIQSRTSHTRRLADRHRPADRVQGQTDSLPIGIDLPIGLDPNRGFADRHQVADQVPTWTRGLADRDHITTITRSGSMGNTTLGRLGAESKTMDTRRYRDKRPTSKEPLERLRRSFGPLNKFWRQRIRRRRKNTTFTLSTCTLAY